MGGQLVEVIILNGYMLDRAWRLQGDGVRWAIGWEDMDLGADGSVKGGVGGSDCEPFLLGDWGRKRGAGQDHEEVRMTSYPGNEIKPLVSPSLSEWKRKTVNFFRLDLVSLPNVRVDLRSLVWNSAISFTVVMWSVIGIKKALLFSQPYRTLHVCLLTDKNKR